MRACTKRIRSVVCWIAFASTSGCGGPAAEAPLTSSPEIEAEAPQAIGADATCASIERSILERNAALPSLAIERLLRPVGAPTHRGEAGSSALEEHLARCEAQWRSRLDRLAECSEEPVGSPLDTVYASDPEQLVATIAGDLVDIRGRLCGRGLDEGGCRTEVVRVAPERCEWISIRAAPPACTARTGHVEVSDGGHPALRRWLLDAVGLSPADPARADHDLPRLWASAGFAIRAYEDSVECERGGACVGPAYRLPPWRAGPPAFAPEPLVVGDELVQLDGVVRQVGLAGPYALYELASPLRGCRSSFAIYDSRRDRHRWIAGQMYESPHAGREARTARWIPPASLFVGWQWIDLDEGVALAFIRDERGPSVEALRSAAREGRCDFGCGEP